MGQYPTRFNIRFFTPATRALFNVIPSDVGRPLTDLKSLAADDALLDDAQTVFKSQTPLEREIQGQSGHWFVRRIMPYRASDDKTEGVVITYEDVTERRRTAEALNAAKRQAELASLAKSRFLAAAKRLADRCFRGAFDFLDRTGDSVLAHGRSPCVLRRHVSV